MERHEEGERPDQLQAIVCLDERKSQIFGTISDLE